VTPEQVSAVLTGKTAIVTGAGRGIGKAIATKLADQGAYLVCTDVADADTTAKEITDGGGSAVGHEHDVRDWAGWQQIVDEAMEATGSVDILVNNAGVRSLVPDNAINQDEDNWDRVVDINLKGPWLGMKAALPHMVDGDGGRIVNIASLASVLGLINLCAYSASKGGVLSMSRQVAIEYARQGVTVNSIGPGITSTPGMHANLTDEMHKQFTEAVPMGRLGDPNDQAAMVAYLVGPEAGYITGQYFAVDGGWTAH
jgi:NAD(P)-dependent dehydrogenase (short-subunit alcohol dehydrogenase family)